jgi:2-amino-4-hydroxy-6-hydroxymethyldihydropteridine diphosphokinase
MGQPGPCVVRASLADQPHAAAGARHALLAIALGANLPSPAGQPLATLLAVRPLLTQLLQAWGEPLRLHWSPLFHTTPVGGPADQPAYLNAALLVEEASPPSAASAGSLLIRLLQLEQCFGRLRRERWGPRSLDLDLLWWGDLHCSDTNLELPHPRLLERSFVLAPLAAINATLVPPGAAGPTGALLAQLTVNDASPAPHRLAGRPGWPE